VNGVAVCDAVAAMADLNGDGGWAATGESGSEDGYALAQQFLTARKPPSLSFRDAEALPMAFLSAFAGRTGLCCLPHPRPTRVRLRRRKT
jgi:NADPH:quinone reductase-like Zn-dependent oxidoreductase